MIAGALLVVAIYIFPQQTSSALTAVSNEMKAMGDRAGGVSTKPVVSTSGRPCVGTGCEFVVKNPDGRFVDQVIVSIQMDEKPANGPSLSAACQDTRESLIMGRYPPEVYNVIRAELAKGPINLRCRSSAEMQKTEDRPNAALALIQLLMHGGAEKLASLTQLLHSQS